MDELAALKTESGIRNWHLMVPNWSDAGGITSGKGRRKAERQLEKEVRGWQNKEERRVSERERKRQDEEWAVMEYVRRGEVEAKRVSERGGEELKEGILAQLRKRKQQQQQNKKADGSKLDSSKDKATASFLDDAENHAGEGSSHLMTLSGEMSVFDAPNNKNPPETNNVSHPATTTLRIQSQSDFATAVVLLDAVKLAKCLNNTVVEDGHDGSNSTTSAMKKQGVYIEYTIQTGGLAQIGWVRAPPPANTPATTDSSEQKNNANDEPILQFLPNSDIGDGVGDDGASYGYDGSRGMKFHAGKETPYGFSSSSSNNTTQEKKAMEWKTGDVLGCWCKFASNEGDNNSENNDECIEIGYSLNGVDMGAAFQLATTNSMFGYYPAVSLNLGEVLDVNVGPNFSFDVRDGCVGACILAKEEQTQDDHDNGGDGDSTLVTAQSEKECSSKAATDIDSPPRKKQRDVVAFKENNDSGSANGTGSKVSAPGPVAKREKFDLNKCSSVEELKEMGPDELKNILLSMGLKCG